MRLSFKQLFITVLLLAGLSLASLPSHASIAAATAFSALKGTTTIDSGGVIHSQARSIYSMGGGMVSFNGKTSTFIAVDPPSFSAGCSGISWHFGGFAFISMDELRQMVEAIGQASLGIAVDLAMQTLCPQCYAVMSKLRDMANMMRNAAADSCRVAKTMGAALGSMLGTPEGKQTSCSEASAAQGKSDGFLNSVAGSMCRSIQSVNTFLKEEGDNVIAFLNKTLGADKKTPNQEMLDATYNVQYEILTALGYKDGPIKDLLLNATGMTIYTPKPAADCSEVFAGMNFNNAPKGWFGEAADGSESDKADAAKTPARPEASGSAENFQVCHAPPLLDGVTRLAEKIMCGVRPQDDLKRFADKFQLSENMIASSSIGIMCRVKNTQDVALHDLVNKAANQPLYTCREDSSRCLKPQQLSYEELVPQGGEEYTGLAWMIADALYSGAENVIKKNPHTEETIAILNGSGYPLYRLLNLAAVYPGMTHDLLMAYSATISVQYAMDTLDVLVRPGVQSAIETKGAVKSLSADRILVLRNFISDMFTDGAEYKDRVLKMHSQKRALVQSILEINRALQADVISQGLANNERLALSIKQQLERNNADGGE